MKKYPRNIIFSTLALIGFLLPASAFAFQKTSINVTVQNDFVVEPGKTELKLNPGESVVKNITITNRINRVVKFKLSTEDLIGTSDPNQPVVLLGDGRGPYSIKDLIAPEITEFSLAFGERIVIPVKVSIPIDVEPRGYYGALIVSNEPEKISPEQSAEAAGKTRIISRIGSLFLVKINGEGKESGSLVAFKPIGPARTFYEKKPQGFEIAYQNTGNVHLVPYGKITIRNMLGQIMGALPVDAYFVLPDSIRYRQVEWSEGMAFGRYTADLSLYKGYGTDYENARLSFWILPWKILLSVFIAIVIVVFAVYYFATRFELRKK